VTFRLAGLPTPGNDTVEIAAIQSLLINDLLNVLPGTTADQFTVSIVQPGSSSFTDVTVTITADSTNVSVPNDIANQIAGMITNHSSPWYNTSSQQLSSATDPSFAPIIGTPQKSKNPFNPLLILWIALGVLGLILLVFVIYKARKAYLNSKGDAWGRHLHKLETERATTTTAKDVFAVELGSGAPASSPVPVSPTPTATDDLPEGWQMKYDAGQKANYYYNEGTGQSSWERPR